jgi:cytochrome c oxidase assembly factor CtaG
MLAVRRALVSLALVALPGTAFAHDLGAARDTLPGWTWDLWITVPLGGAALVAAVGWWRLCARSSAGVASLYRRGGFFLTGWMVLATALVSPLHAAGERSFTLHMAEHEMLMLLAAPLLALSRPLAVMLWAWPRDVRRFLGQISAVRPIWRGLSAPVPATLLQASALWLWHMPSLFDAALASEGWHAVQHLSFLASALLFWTAMLQDQRGQRGLAILCLFATSVISGALGALMALSESPWYTGYARLGMAPFGMRPAEDQQMAGLLMWIPGGLVHAIAALVLMRGLLRADAKTEVAHAR